jgi:hypothetical protein
MSAASDDEVFSPLFQPSRENLFLLFSDGVAEEDPATGLESTVECDAEASSVHGDHGSGSHGDYDVHNALQLRRALACSSRCGVTGVAEPAPW